MENQRAAGAYVFSQIVDSLWIAKMTLRYYHQRRDGGRTEIIWPLFVNYKKLIEKI